MFAYCGNNPVSRRDFNGMLWQELGNWLEKAWEYVKEFASNTFGAGSTTSETLYESETPVIPDTWPITITNGTNSTKTVSSHGDSSKPISVYADGVLNDFESSSAGLYLNIGDFTLDIGAALDDIGVKGSVSNGDEAHSIALRINFSDLKVGIEWSSSVSLGDITSTSYTNASINGSYLAVIYLALKTGQLVPYLPKVPVPAGV